jgi:hypothetical protein
MARNGWSRQCVVSLRVTFLTNHAKLKTKKKRKRYEWRHDIQPNDTQQSDIQQNVLSCHYCNRLLTLLLHLIRPNVVLLIAIVLSVVAPYVTVQKIF